MAELTFEQISQLINSGEISGATQAICNGINALATGAVRSIKTGTAENLKGIVGEARDTSNNTEKVVFSNIEDESGLLLVVAIASMMGIQLHNNLKTANPELWQQLKTLTQSRFFKTLIAKPQDIQQRVISSITEGLLNGPPCILTASGDLYISGDILEMVFQSLQSVGAFNVSSGTFTPLDLPASGVTKYYPLKTTNLTLPQFEELLNSRWADFQALASNSDSSSTAEAYPILNINNFTEFLAKLRELMGDEVYNTIFNNFNGGYFHAQRRTGGSRPYFEYNLFVITNPLNNSNYPIFNYNQFGRAGYYLVGRSYNDSSWFFTGNFIKIVYNNNTWSVQNNGGSYPVYYADGTDFWSGGNQYTYRGEWSFYTYEGGQGDTPEGITQEEGAKLPSSDTSSITSWITSNLADYDTTKLVTDAPGSFNIPAHQQGWYKITIPYSLGYNLNLDGTTEEPEGGAATQTVTTTTSQEDENEAAGIEDTGTGTGTIINYYESKEGSEKETTGQTDAGEIEDEGVKELSWNAAGMTAIYCPTDAQMGSVSNWLWSTDFTDVINKFFQDPAEAMISLQRCWLPFSSTGAQEVVFGRVGSGISVPTANKFQSYNVPGSVTVTKFYNNYLDYEAQASIYVPFAGFQSLDLRDIMDATLNLKYKWDLASGQGVAELWVTRDDMTAPLYQWQINCNEQIPCSSSNQSQFMLGIAGALTSTVGGYATSGPLGALGGLAKGVMDLHNTQHVSQGGSIGGNASAVACKTPFITIRYPKNNTPAGFNEFDGIGIDTVGTLGSFQGFVRCREVHLQAGGGASKAELEQIEAILKEGVIL